MLSQRPAKRALEVTYVRGFPVTKQSVGNPEFTEAAMDYKAKDGDVVVFSYARVGSHWLTYILWKILHKGEQESLKDMAEYEMLVPFIERAGTEVADSLKEPRIYKHHLPYNMITKNEKAKYVHIYRNPVDVVVSFYHYTKEFSVDKDFDFDDFFEEFMRGEVYCGDYFNHVLAAYAHRNDTNLLMVSYEELKHDTRNQILHIAQFLGEYYHTMLLKDEGLLNKILDVTNFENMKKNLKVSLRIKQGGEKTVDFFRAGIVGGGKETLTEAQLNRLENRIADRMKETEFVELWLSKTSS